MAYYPCGIFSLLDSDHSELPAKNLYGFLNCLFYPSKISNLIIIQPEVLVFLCLLLELWVRHCRAKAGRERGSVLFLSCHLAFKKPWALEQQLGFQHHHNALKSKDGKLWSVHVFILNIPVEIQLKISTLFLFQKCFKMVNPTDF